MNKKFIALTLATSCLLSISASAFSDDSKIELENKYAVSRLTDYKIINGNPDGSFTPDNNLTRAEVSKMIFALCNVTATDPADASKYANQATSFTDINNHWAKNYISYCYSESLVSGKSSTSFAPDDSVTGLELAKILLVELGIDANIGELTGSSWETNTQMYANIFGLFYDVNANVREAVSKEVAAQIISNALSAKVAQYDADVYGNYVQGTKTLAESYKVSDVSTNYARAIYNEIVDAGLVSNAMAGCTDLITDFYKINSGLTDAHLSITQMSPGMDEVFIAKVSSGSMSTVKTALEARIQTLINEKAWYPSDMDAANMAKIYTKGDYIMLYVSGNEGNYAKAEAIFNSYAK